MPQIDSRILAYLSKNKDGYSSGQAMAKGLGLTRAAVWKAVESLRGAGYVIESSPAKGYRLAEVPDLLGAREITAGLDTDTFGRVVYALDQVDSTNTFASRLAADGAKEGTLVISDSQSAGRGRLGRNWSSPPGMNVYMSLILRPGIPPVDAPLITLAASVALAKSVNGLYGIDARIKWPNDLLIDGRKLAGMLTEMNAEPERVRHIVLGVGVDVNMPKRAFPADIRDASTSVMVELGRKVNRAELVRGFLFELEQVYHMFLSGGRAQVLDEWRGLSCTLGRNVRIHAVSGYTEGLAVNVDDTGALVLKHPDGRLVTVTGGDVGFI